MMFEEREKCFVEGFLGSFQLRPTRLRLGSAELVRAEFRFGELRSNRRGTRAGEQRHDEFAAVVVEPDTGVARIEAIFEAADHVGFIGAVLNFESFFGLCRWGTEVFAVFAHLDRRDIGCG